MSILKTVDEAINQWKEIKSQISDIGLYVTVNTTIVGMELASQLKNVEMLKFAAQMDLDLVDLLEGHFEKNI